MVIIDDKIISSEIFEQYFQCNLNICKGACCVNGLYGAPLEEEEKSIIIKYYTKIKKHLTKESISEIEKQGCYVYFEGKFLSTPTIGSGICVYGIKQKNKHVLCAFEKSFYSGEIPWKKPISCDLFPIRVSKTRLNEMLNYEKIDLCKSACSLGNEKKIKVYEFLKKAIVRKYGKLFFNKLKKLHNEHYNK